MAYTGNAYGDLSPRVAGYAVRELLKRAEPLLTISRYLQSKPLPSNSTKTIIFRRYNSLAPALTPITEGVTPAGSKITKTDVQVDIAQYGDWLQLTDWIADLHTDPVLNEMIGILGEQAALTIEKVDFGVIKAGTNVVYSNGTARTAVNTALTRPVLRRATRALKRQNAMTITSIVSASPNYATTPVAPAYIALCHVDCEGDIRDLTGFKPVEEYGSYAPLPGEIGKCEDVRFITSTVFTAWADAGAAKGTMISTTGTAADVYPIIILGRDCAGAVPLKGKQAIVPMVLNANTPRGGDELGQRGSVAWKAWHAAIILNDAWMVRIECAATE